MSSHKSLYFDEQRVNELATHGVHSLETLKGWLGEVGPRERIFGTERQCRFCQNPNVGRG